MHNDTFAAFASLRLHDAPKRHYGATAVASKIHVHPRIAAWPQRGFTPCPFACRADLSRRNRMEAGG